MYGEDKEYYTTEEINEAKLEFVLGEVHCPFKNSGCRIDCVMLNASVRKGELEVYCTIEYTNRVNKE